MADRLALASIALIALLGCGGASTPPPEIPPIDDESMVGIGGGDETTDAGAPALPSEGGARVRLGRVEVPTGQLLALPGGPCTELVVFVESGNLRTPADEDLPGGTLYRTQRDTQLMAIESSTAIVSVNVPAAMVAATEGVLPPEAAEGDDAAADSDSEPDAESDAESESESPTCTERVMGDIVADIGGVEVLPNAGGKLKVQIVLDEDGGATFGSFAILEADADLPVPVHTHEGTAEVLFIDSGDGTMILGERRFQLAPGAVVYVPPDVEHGYEPGTEPLRAYQVYDPPGPEQRFRSPEPPAEEAAE